MKSQPPRKNCQFLLIFMLVSDEEQTVWKCDWTKELDQTAVPWEENASRLSVEQALPSPNWKSSRGRHREKGLPRFQYLPPQKRTPLFLGPALGKEVLISGLAFEKERQSSARVWGLPDFLQVKVLSVPRYHTSRYYCLNVNNM